HLGEVALLELVDGAVVAGRAGAGEVEVAGVQAGQRRQEVSVGGQPSGQVAHEGAGVEPDLRPGAAPGSDRAGQRVLEAGRLGAAGALAEKGRRKHSLATHRLAPVSVREALGAGAYNPPPCSLTKARCAAR